jgi:hypothetical protein
MRNRIISGFVDNSWLADISPFLEGLDESGLMQAVESLVQLPDATVARETLVKIGESKHSSERIKSRIAEWFVTTASSTHGMRGRLERVLPKGYKVAKKKVDRFPEAMREPYITLALDGLMEVDKAELSLGPMIRLLRNREIAEQVYLRAVEFLAMRDWQVDEKLDKAARKALPKGYDISEEGYIIRDFDTMDEPFLTAAGDSLLDYRGDNEEWLIEELIGILVNHNSDERVLDRIMDRFSREEWSVLGAEADIERRLTKEYEMNSIGHGQDFRIVRVLARL